MKVGEWPRSLSMHSGSEVRGQAPPTSTRPERSHPEPRLRPDQMANDGLASPRHVCSCRYRVGRQRVLRLTVPKSALIGTERANGRWCCASRGGFKTQPVKIGLRGRDHVNPGGLEDGAEVVVAANFLIDAESNLKGRVVDFLGA